MFEQHKKWIRARIACHQKPPLPLLSLLICYSRDWDEAWSHDIEWVHANFADDKNDPNGESSVSSMRSVLPAAIRSIAESEATIIGRTIMHRSAFVANTNIG